MIVKYETVGKLIRYHRLSKKMTKEELVFRIESSPAYISYMESGKKKPSLEKLMDIAEVLGVTVNDFVYGPASVRD